MVIDNYMGIYESLEAHGDLRDIRNAGNAWESIIPGNAMRIYVY